MLRAIRLLQWEDRLKAGSVWVQSGHVFTTETGEPCDLRNARRALKVAAGKAGHTDVGLHTLRHSAATVMIDSGTPLKVVPEILGHLSVSITGDIYGHVSPDVSAQAMDALGAALDRVNGASLMVVGATQEEPTRLFHDGQKWASTCGFLQSG